MGNLAACSQLSICNNLESLNMKRILKNSKQSLNSSLPDQSMAKKTKERLAFVSHQDGRVSQWDIFESAMINIYDVHNQECRAIDIDPTNSHLLTGGFDKNLVVYDLDEETITKKVYIHTNKIVHVKWHPFFPIFASSSADKTVRLFASDNFCRKYSMKILQEF